ncbi:MAG: geranylgeranylglyceryl/heptaprenylglyceryl phosphate synthase [Ferruginibacter sp.]
MIDPDKVNDGNMAQLIKLSVDAGVDYFLVGGSLVISNYLDDCLQLIKRNCNIPTILFPGSPNQVSKYADALLYLSLISGRNADLLIGQHVISAPVVKKSGLEIMPTGIWLLMVAHQLPFLTSAMQRLYQPIKMKLPCVLPWPAKCWA